MGFLSVFKIVRRSTSTPRPRDERLISSNSSESTFTSSNSAKIPTVLDIPNEEAKPFPTRLSCTVRKVNLMDDSEIFDTPIYDTPITPRAGIMHTQDTPLHIKAGGESQFDESLRSGHYSLRSPSLASQAQIFTYRLSDHFNVTTTKYPSLDDTEAIDLNYQEPTIGDRFQIENSSDTSEDEVLVDIEWEKEVKKRVENILEEAKYQGIPEKKAKHVIEKYLSDNSTKPLSNEDKYSEIESIIEDNISLHTQFSSSYDEIYEEGKTFARIGLYEKALECFRKAILTNGIKPEYYQKTALSYFFLGNIEKAEVFCRETIKIDPDDYKTYVILSSICRRKYADSMAKKNFLSAQKYKEQFYDYLQKSTPTTTTSEPQKEFSECMEQTLMYIEEENFQKANIYLTRASTNIQNRTDALKLHGSPDSHQEVQQHKSQLELINEIIRHTKAQALEGDISNEAPTAYEEWTPQKKQIVLEALEKFKLSPESRQLDELREQIARCNQNIMELTQQCDSYVTRPEVSVAIKENTIREKAAEQKMLIEENPHLNQYFYTFMSTIVAAYNSASVVKHCKVAIDKSNSALSVAQQLLNFIPLCGPMVGTGITSIVEFITEQKIKDDSLHFHSIAYSDVDLHNKILSAATVITLHPSKKLQILFPTEQEPITGFFQRIISSISAAEQCIIKKIYGEEYDTHAKRLGHEDACLVISKYEELHKAAKSTTSTTIQQTQEIIDFIICTIINDYVSDEGASTATSHEEVVFVDLCGACSVEENAASCALPTEKIPFVELCGDVGVKE